MTRSHRPLEERALKLIAAHRPVASASDLAQRISASVRAADAAESAPSPWYRWARLAWPAAAAAAVAAAVLIAVLLRAPDAARTATPAAVPDPLAEVIDSVTDDGLNAMLAMEVE